MTNNFSLPPPPIVSQSQNANSGDFRLPSPPGLVPPNLSHLSPIAAVNGNDVTPNVSNGKETSTKEKGKEKQRYAKNVKIYAKTLNIYISEVWQQLTAIRSPYLLAVRL
jgi:hypothetical protein